MYDWTYRGLLIPYPYIGNRIRLINQELEAKLIPYPYIGNSGRKAKASGRVSLFPTRIQGTLENILTRIFYNGLIPYPYIGNSKGGRKMYQRLAYSLPVYREPGENGAGDIPKRLFPTRIQGTMDLFYGGNPRKLIPYPYIGNPATQLIIELLFFTFHASMLY